MADFIGRRKELERLKLLLKKRSASFVVVRGRRRIGKSRLIQEFGKSLTCHLFTGLPPSPETSRQSQLNEFSRQMARVFETPVFQLRDWGEAFWYLGKACAKGRMLVAFDEISWIGSRDPEFLGQLKNLWDLYLSRNPKLVLIVCGSASSWIQKNILSSTGFVGRISLDMRLEELPLLDAVKFWGDRARRVSAHEIFKLLAVTGGIPRYLEEILPQRSAEENIRRLCFDSEGLLFREFDQIFSDLFSTRAVVYAKILGCLAQKAFDLSQVSRAVKINRRETVSGYLNDLQQAGFVAEDSTWDLRSFRTSRLRQYRLCDNYVRFYLRYVLPHKEAVNKGLFEFTPLELLPGWNAVMGLQFENLVLQNCRALFPELGITLSEIAMFGPYFQRKTARTKGCQIDLLIQTRHRTLYICEVKFCADKVGTGVVHEIKAKQQRLSVPRGWSVRTVLIHVNGVTQEVLQSEDLDHAVDFSQLLDS